MICIREKGEQYVPTVQHLRSHENTNTLPCTKGMLRGDRSLNQEQGNTFCKMADKLKQPFEVLLAQKVQDSEK